jgi:thiosulfate dehydrogenase
MNMKKTTKGLMGAAVAVIVSTALLVTAQAGQPLPEEEMARQKAELFKMADKGYAIWHGSMPSTTTNGLACANCHPDAAASNPQTFPKYMPMFGRVTSWREMSNWCIENPQKGEPLDIAGEDMMAIEAYAMLLHRGRPIEPGLATRQTTPVAVQYGTGFPTKPSGIGYDTK